MTKDTKHQAITQRQGPFRTIKTFVRHQGRLTQGQEKALDEYLPLYGIPYQAELIKLDPKQTTVFEIGFGNGDAMIHMAKEAPDQYFIGCEVHTPGVGHALMQIHKQQLTNIKCIMHDAIDVMDFMLPENSLDRIQVFFPDPWHKKRHHKRRLISDSFCLKAKKLLKTNGILHIATDWEAYAEHSKEVLQQHNAFQAIHKPASGLNARPDYRPQTKFEARGLRLNHRIYDLIYQYTPTI